MTPILPASGRAITNNPGQQAPWGLDPTGANDSAPAIQAALDALPPGSGGEVVLAPGTYLIGSTLTLSRSIRLRGYASGDSGYGSTELVFTGTGPCIHLPHLVDWQQAQWARVEDLVIRCSGPGTVGVKLNVRAYLRNLFISGFSQQGIDVDTRPEGGGGNANCSRIEQCRITGCGGHGLRFCGGDSNAGLVELVDSSGNGGFGFWDTSITGNTYLQCHTSVNLGGPFKVSNSGAGAMLVNCYTEGGQPTAQVHPPAVILGGTWGTPNDVEAGLQVARTSSNGLRLGGADGSGGALVEQPTLITFTANGTTPMIPGFSYGFPYISGDLVVGGQPGIAPGIEGQRITIRNNSGHLLTFQDKSVLPGSGFDLATPTLTLKYLDVVHLIHFSNVWYEEGRMLRARP